MANRRRSGRRGIRRRRKLHGWDTASAFISIDVGSPPEPYTTALVLQSYQGSTGELIGEPDSFYCERVMLDLFPFLGRFDESDPETIRFWDWMLLTCDGEDLQQWIENEATSLNQADLYNNGTTIWSDAARVLQQGVAPVYFSTLFNQTEVGGPLAVEEVVSPADTVSSGVMPFGMSAVRGIDLNTKFSLKQGQVLALLVGCADDPAWVTGDAFTVGVWYKALWTQRRT